MDGKPLWLVSHFGPQTAMPHWGDDVEVVARGSYIQLVRATVDAIKRDLNTARGWHIAGSPFSGHWLAPDGHDFYILRGNVVSDEECAGGWNITPEQWKALDSAARERALPQWEVQ